jgi:hypothetical protein
MKTQEELLQQRKELADHKYELMNQMVAALNQINALDQQIHDLNQQLGYSFPRSPRLRITSLPEEPQQIPSQTSKHDHEQNIKQKPDIGVLIPPAPTGTSDSPLNG